MTDRPEWPEPRVPKYYGLKRHLQELTQALAPGSSLPPERILAAEHGLSRTSVRQALHELVVEGRLERVQGRGTFVARPKKARPLRLARGPAGPGDAPWGADHPAEPAAEPAGSVGSGRSARSRRAAATALAEAPAGGTERYGSQLLGAEQVAADDEVAARLELRRAARALRVERLRTVDGEPMAVELLWLAVRRFTALARRLGRALPADPTGADEALTAALAAAYAGGPPSGEETIETVLAPPREAALLGTEVGAPLLLVSRHIRDATGAAVEWSQAWYRGDRYKFVLTVPPP
ncbi:MAG TPA: GntR family transcriptional regulator [Mycobacteriales bacterium]|nr:GntR family transcriptional regulator [Mycobacteriales bacterium]